MDTGEAVVRTAADHLEAPLSAEEPTERDYHVRNSLLCRDSVTANAEG